MHTVSGSRSSPFGGCWGFRSPLVGVFSHGLRPRPHDPEDREPGRFQHGGQHEAASRVERHFRDRNLMPRLADSGRRADPMQGWRSQLHPRVSSLALTPFCFAFSSCGVSASRSRSRSVCADVAVHWIPLATIVQRVRELVCWDGADLRWRAQLPESAAKRAGE